MRQGWEQGPALTPGAFPAQEQGVTPGWHREVTAGSNQEEVAGRQQLLLGANRTGVFVWFGGPGFVPGRREASSLLYSSSTVFRNRRRGGVRKTFQNIPNTPGGYLGSSVAVSELGTCVPSLSQRPTRNITHKRPGACKEACS